MVLYQVDVGIEAGCGEDENEIRKCASYNGTGQRDSSIDEEYSGLRKVSLRLLLERWREEGEREHERRTS